MQESPAAAGASTQQTITLSGTAAATTPVETATPPTTGAPAVITSTGPSASATTVVTPLVIGPSARQANARKPADDTIPGPASSGGLQ
jgi:hypothetical protein